MLTLASAIRIPTYVSFSVVGEDAFLLNTQTNKYYGLEQVGTRLWQLLNENNSLQSAHQILIKEYEIGPAELENDLLELVAHLMENGLVELVEA